MWDVFARAIKSAQGVQPDEKLKVENGLKQLRISLLESDKEELIGMLQEIKIGVQAVFDIEHMYIQQQDKNIINIMELKALLRPLRDLEILQEHETPIYGELE